MLGHDAGSPAGMEYELGRIYPTGPLDISSGYVHTESFEAFQKIQPADDPIVIFVPPVSANIPNFATLYVYEWYNEWGDQIGNAEYLWHTVESFAVAERLIPVKQEKELTGPVTHPEIVVPNGTPFHGYQLRLTAYYTQGNNAWFYDLTMLDANDQPAKPNTPVWVYLPYPEGHKAGTKYKLNHYSNGLYDGTDASSDPVEVYDTLHGLMFRTDSFSPFILSTDGTAAAVQNPAADVPKTGDHYPLAGLCIMMLLAISGMAVLKRTVRP